MAFVSPLSLPSYNHFSSQATPVCSRCKAVASPPKRPHTPMKTTYSSLPTINVPFTKPARSPSPSKKSRNSSRTRKINSVVRNNESKPKHEVAPVSLPQHTTDPTQLAKRVASLHEHREQYKWRYEAVSDAAFIKNMPESENPNRRWVVQMKRLEQQCLENTEQNTTKKIKRRTRTKQNQSQKKISESSPDVFAQYKELFNSIDLPDIAVDNAFLRDDVFGWYRVAGPNPMQIQAASAEQLQSFICDGLCDESFRTLKGFKNDSVAQAIIDQRFFVVDYSELSDLCRDDLPGRKANKYLYAPLALFCVPDVPEGTCAPPLPIGIMGSSSSKTNDITWAWSESEDEWFCAKQMVQVADAFIHETVHHFARTHLLVEAIVCSTYRSFDSSHPVFTLLSPHFEGTAFINSTSLTQLLCEGGTIDRLTAPPIRATREHAARSLVHDFSFENAMPDIDVETRGIKSDKLCFPYRDDALDLWDAIIEFVTKILSKFYKSDEDVMADEQLQTWGRELVWSGRVTGFGETSDGGLRSVDYVVRAVAMVIFTASVQHAAVNFPQVSHMQFAPAMPLAGRESNVHGGFLGMMPDVEEAEEQMCAAQMLGVVRYTRLGDYGKGVMEALEGTEAVEQFKKKLKDLSDHVEYRNKAEVQAGLFAYDFLRPDLIPQSINV